MLLSYLLPLQAPVLLACEQALLFGQAKPAAQGRASKQRSREGPRKAFLSSAPCFHVFPRVPLTHLLFKISLTWRACLRATFSHVMEHFGEKGQHKGDFLFFIFLHLHFFFIFLFTFSSVSGRVFCSLDKGSEKTVATLNDLQTVH